MSNMTNEEYLNLSEITARQFPDGLRIPAATLGKIEALLMEFKGVALQIEDLKKHIFYTEAYTGSEAAVVLVNSQAQTLHAMLGMVGEVAEVCETVDHNLTPHNRDALVKELGDVRWYEAILLRQAGISQEELHEANIAKVKARYPEGFSCEAAVNRAEGDA